MEEMVSIIVPVYNVEKYLEECLNSILGQTYKNLEILLIDDGSTDASGNMCDTLAENDERIKVIHKRNSGVSAARNTGLYNCNGQYITFVDSDDYIELDYVQVLMESMKQFDVDIAECGFYELYPNEEKIKRGIETGCYVELDDTFNYCKHQEIGYIWGKLFKRNCLENLFFDETISLAEDALWMVQVCKNVKKLYYSDKAKYIYRMVGQSVTHKRDVRDLETMLIAGKKIIELQSPNCMAFYSANMEYMKKCRRTAAELVCRGDSKRKAEIYKEVRNRKKIIWKVEDSWVQKLTMLSFLYFPAIYFYVFKRKKEKENQVFSH